jgi:3',5'-cyclic AMP phosphodiesterase CpdA
LLFVATGDLTETAGVVDDTEFARAEAFLRPLAKGRAADNGLQHLFVVPGNHDIVFDEAHSLERRWQPYCSFYNKLFEGMRPVILDRSAHKLSQVHDRTAEGYVIAEINSALYVAKGLPDAERGQVDARTVTNLTESLEVLRNATPTAFESAVRIAIMHHHPVLLPSLVEAERGYDAIANAHDLLRVLQDFGFHVILHGHKHYPQTFSYDPDYAWSTKAAAPGLLIVAGGSAGSSGLPPGTRATPIAGRGLTTLAGIGCSGP